ncbi:HAMP domain-containing sensor histidine kinase [Streptomyces sp. NBC_00102]|uniref:sensor histidine kinase n=1 Tax=Streptomyces sp. NBC_00102 TaxID=2975652 RepID=UPI00224DBBDD|nr:HAMP domain-containing sensor histidine kinase [Streptomyces sp. NBC_00102]MCX5402317.1 HAMP domain-containing histidine kinase [Streptomyces sp. NBC_00102]
MRWALAKVALAVTTMVAVAFAVPLGLVVREMARDRAFSAAEREAAAVAPALSITTEPDQLRRVVAAAAPRSAVAVHLPEHAGSVPPVIGDGQAVAAAVDETRRLGRASTTTVPGGFALLQPVAVSTGETAIIEVFVSASDVDRGVIRAWVVLAAVGVGLVAGSLVAADRLGVRTVRPARGLAEGARKLGAGDLDIRIPEDGPRELRLAAAAFNSMAEQLTRLLAGERERAADLSHRLRTPLTVLRLNAASLGEGPAAEQTRAAVAQLEREVDTVIRTARQAAAAPRGPVGQAAGCDAADVVRERMEFWSALAEDQGRAASLAGTDRPVPVPVSRSDLAAALDALLGNVFRHTPEGTPFSVDVHGGDDAVLVLVSDAGPGVPDPAAALERGKGSGSAGSTGLGLDIARRLAESTGGDIRVGTSVLGGAEMRLRIQRSGVGSGARSRRGARGRRRLRTGRVPASRWGLGRGASGSR